MKLKQMTKKEVMVMLDILSYDFMQRAVMAVVAISIFAPILGIFLILRRQSLMSDTLSHVSLAGVALGVVLGISPTITTIIVVVLAAILLEYLRVVYKHYMEISTAILMSLGLALSLIIMSKSHSSSSMSLEQYLFGSIITISMEQVVALFAIAAIILILTVLFIRPMYILTFDEDTAFVDGLPVRLMSVLFNIVTGVAIALTIPAAGALLVSTIMVLPASIAMRLGKNFKTVILLGIVIGFSGMLSGIFLSYFFETPASATITMIFISIFLLVSLGGMLKKRLF
ncbi:zinc ABC transporter permease [Streptococcus pyogenes HSC5]|uniref:High-affinity zinc uptake system membrane protein n=1 Tax=Streptococcus pyogenes serotype M12 (strain MGAS9429) TaxID=370551 RepID=Q1JNY2_STRPC|nr:high-affinity zinc uptake system membrane protein [Streptococcus pyogenes MGAS6180]ABF31267.1 high-affinity zinc uptake system membrane protein [Streptococcus pyogenes MGAS9429]ABF33146.1 High-affinity zinc uptake system membrane protein znuB [Streptococcus pyogenes MGAS10270]ABF35134.1 High-affinity zinc uptake system membrane protein znuB [Streptococcus pyogenes MGAS2096]AGQ27015.1 zinc ABC transporter permease [Streptococcus pyogenes HSC5]